MLPDVFMQAGFNFYLDFKMFYSQLFFSLQYNEKDFTLWDRFEIDGKKANGEEMTIGDLIEFFKASY